MGELSVDASLTPAQPEAYPAHETYDLERQHKSNAVQQLTPPIHAFHRWRLISLFCRLTKNQQSNV